jgi:protein-arginine kinase
LKNEIQDIVNDLNYIVNQLNSCKDILRSSKGIAIDRCIISLNKTTKKYSDIRLKIMKL